MLSHPSFSRTPPPTATIRELLPASTLARLVLCWVIVIAFQIGGHSWLAAPITTGIAVIAFLVLFTTILYAAFGVVGEADHLAHALGEPYGTLILTLSIVSIEVILIVAVMLGPSESATIGRDSIFAVMMIILNFVIGICLVLGGLKHGDQEYNAQGAVAYLSMIALLTGTALALPNVVSSGTGSFLPIQAAAVAMLTALLYSAFIGMQTRRYRRFFVQPELGSLSIPVQTPERVDDSDNTPSHVINLDRRAIIIRSVVLVALVLPIVLLAHSLAILIDHGVEQVGAPVAVGGVLIAIIVFTPESITAIKAAFANEMQRALNLCLGAFVSTVGLTVPAVLVIGLISGKTVTLGLNALDTVLLVITIALSTLTFLGHRTSAVQGSMHLTLFMIYAVFLFVP